MLNALSGALGQAIIVAALVVTMALEVLDQRATADADGTTRRRRPGQRLRSRALRVALVVLVVAAVAATAVRIFVVVR